MSDQNVNDAFNALSKKQYATAANSFRRVLSLTSNNGVMWSNLGTVYYLFVLENMIPCVGQSWLINLYVFDETNRISQRLRNTAMSILDGQHIRGLYRCLKEAEMCFDKAIQYDDKLSTARHWRARLYRDTGRFEEALKELKALMSDADTDIARSAAKDLWELQDMTWLKINDASLPSRPAAQKIEKLFGEELDSLLKTLSVLS